jgi:hypothetical protein
MEVIGPTAGVTEFDQVNIKDLTEQELFANILMAGAEWTEEERDRVARAYAFISYIHRDDTHRDQPYTYHLLRSTNRIIEYLHITDPDVIVGVLLHDGVEDHPDDVIQYDPDSESLIDPGVYIPEDTEEKQLVAFDTIGRHFSWCSARIVRGMTHVPIDFDRKQDQAAWLQIYVDHIEQEIEDIQVFYAKWADWADNGLSLIHSKEKLTAEQQEWYETKYGIVMPVLERRFYKIDIQGMLDEDARQNVMRSFELAHSRLNVPVDTRPIARLIINNFEPA